ncbi:MAG: preprotein translocase subunit YajC [Pyrinomonadaceae bacterium]|nr:preprotein translocase subunit YajC [Pyrinomonadaceae bacterium]
MEIVLQFLPFIAIFAIFYFLVIMPQRKRQKEAQEMIASLKINDVVVTNGGVIGKIIETREKSLIIRSAEKSNLEIARSAVVGREIESFVKETK